MDFRDLRLSTEMDLLVAANPLSGFSKCFSFHIPVEIATSYHLIATVLSGPQSHRDSTAVDNEDLIFCLHSSRRQAYVSFLCDKRAF